MKAIIINYLISFVMDMLRDLASRSTTSIDDDIVQTLNDNMTEIKTYISDKV